MTAPQPRIAIITGSTRPGRQARAVAEWVSACASDCPDAAFELVDIADFDLRHLDEPVPPLAGNYAGAHTRAWADVIDRFDGYVFVTPEYNHSLPGALKTALDFLHAEWNDKAAGCVGYGVDGGIRAVEHLRQVLAELKVASVRSTVALTFADDFEGYTSFTPRAESADAVGGMLDELVEWSRGLRAVRKERAAAAVAS